MNTRPIFSPSFGNRPDQLVGRSEIIERAIEGLATYPGSQERAALFIGQRGMGKTALLLEIAERASEENFVVARTTCGENMLDNIIDLLQKRGSQYVKKARRRGQRAPTWTTKCIKPCSTPCPISTLIS